MSSPKRDRKKADVEEQTKQTSKRRLRQQVSHYSPPPKTTPVRTDDYHYLVSNIMT